MQDSENNNVDENSNDHQYNQYANYHTQYTNHQFQWETPWIDNNQYLNANQRQQDNQSLLYQRMGRTLSQESRDTPDNHVHHRYHRRNMSEDLGFHSNPLPSFPQSHNNGPRNQLLNQYSHSHPSWLPPLPTRCKPSEEEIKVEGKELFYNFASEQFRKENLDPYDYFPCSSNLSSFSNPDWKKTGENLRIIADEFSRSPERKELRERAKGVDMSTLTCENFFQLCTELFRRGDGGITQERIIVLFTFISDVAIQQVRQRAERFISQLMEWSIRFIFEHICAWVQEAGGWSVVICRGANFVYRVTMFTFAVVSIVALGVFIKKNWKHL